jgi:SAM-dependent methyltransferase
MSVGAGDFLEVGQEFTELLVERCSIGAHTRLLDVGCGVGRLAVPLTRLLTLGSYDGFDVSRSAIRWCSRNISVGYPHLGFQHVDIRNAEYNPRGPIQPSSFRFPYSDCSFDCVIAMSLYTHLLQDAAVRFASESARVLRPGGYLLSTFFLLNAQSRQLSRNGLGSYRFDTRIDSAYVHDPGHPEAAVAYDEEEVAAFHGALGLELMPPVLYGAWCGRQASRGFQDIAVWRKPPSGDGTA